MRTPGSHQPVLSEEVVRGLNIVSDGYYVDATFGRGGHSALILNNLGQNGRLLAIDQDPAAIEAAQKAPFKNDPRFKIKFASFADLSIIVAEMGWMNKVNGLLMDLGVSSPQLDDPERGFSFSQKGPLDMRMNPQRGLSAANWLNQAKEGEIAEVIKTYGEERFAKRIAAAIVSQRKIKPLADTQELAELISRCVPAYEPGKHPATRSFQAIRIFINQELSALQSALAQSLDVLKTGGRLVVMSFHSLEDHIVKNFMQTQSLGNLPDKLPLREKDIVRRLRVVSRLIRPEAEEINRNPRARSARLRIAEKLA
jgi:16S rRNA (cytosine1402-N4)-methyltransferase